MIQRLPVTQGLQTLLATLTGRPVGLRSVPLDSRGSPVPPPYTLLYPLDRNDDTQTLADNQKAAVLDYQATFVSGPVPNVPNSRGGDEQAQWLADRAWKVVERPANGAPGYTHALNVGVGVTCWRREAREVGGTSDAGDAIITSVIRYRLFLEEQPVA
ncbi:MULTISPECIES: hypothetical protein [Streptomyces rochei group]|uniref:hypothetical protein n=1 Tax=Streptomyces rochei group TaxID=2867164 RepID=UPI0018744400|nr:hypothetical protein [Streptomyces vinaceusdrappus]GHC37427.1 hypothetical protein GCM10010308_65020 [Streptomyces vinaceusdrappus]